MEHPIDKLEEFIDLFRYMESVIESDLHWAAKYDLVFSPFCAGQMKKLGSIEYRNPDESYEEDVRAFYRAVKEKADSFKKIVDLYRRKTDAAEYRYLNS